MNHTALHGRRLGGQATLGSELSPGAALSSTAKSSWRTWYLAAIAFNVVLWAGVIIAVQAAARLLIN